MLYFENKFIIFVLSISLIFQQSLGTYSNPKCRGKKYECGYENEKNVCLNISDELGLKANIMILFKKEKFMNYKNVRMVIIVLEIKLIDIKIG